MVKKAAHLKRPQYIAHHCIQAHPEKINILHECGCDTDKKEYHHPDYEKPFDVELLCKACHIKEHFRINPKFRDSNANGRRGKFKISIAELARRVGKSDAMISHILSGRRRPHYLTAKALAKETGSSIILWLKDDTEAKINALLKESKEAE